MMVMRQQTRKIFLFFIRIEISAYKGFDSIPLRARVFLYAVPSNEYCWNCSSCHWRGWCLHYDASMAPSQVKWLYRATRHSYVRGCHIHYYHIANRCYFIWSWHPKQNSGYSQLLRLHCCGFGFRLCVSSNDYWLIDWNTWYCLEQYYKFPAHSFQQSIKLNPKFQRTVKIIGIWRVTCNEKLSPTWHTPLEQQ